MHKLHDYYCNSCGKHLHDRIMSLKEDVWGHRGKHLHDRIMSLKEDVWGHRAGLTLPLFITIIIL